MLKPPFDPWVEEHGSDTILRSNSLDDLTSADEVRDRVIAHIERLNGAMFVMMQGESLQFGGVVEFACDGKMHRTMFADAACFARSRIHAAAVVIGPDGKPKLDPLPTRSQVQRWAAIADNDDLLEDALIYFGRVSAPDQPHPPTFWFDIYKALECLIERFGENKKREDTFFALDWVPAEVERLKQTANWARHARRKFKKPSPATTEQEAKELMARLFRKAFEKAAAP
ncbi:hypothetical protein [Bradyrhizobium sp. BR 1432]|uniref:hypothetical protein n=1 Tax=Bradyrhizobium sp. BR 1432 TaxID=3447966 RepID=UPI003EE60467